MIIESQVDGIIRTSRSFEETEQIKPININLVDT